MADSNRLPHTFEAATIADLQSIPCAPLQDGVRCWVDSVQQNFYLSRLTALATDGVNVILPSPQALSGVPANTRWLSSLVAGGELVSGVAMLLVDQVALASAAFAPIPGMSVTLSTGAGSLDIEYDVSGAAAVGPAVLRVTVDGVEAQVTGVNVSRAVLDIGNNTVAASMRISGLLAGSHTVVLEYAALGGGNLSIRPQTQSEHATLNVHEAALV
jgi:hypothetical protein